jgi:tRNA (cmo5U34)-methyltransferase
MEGTLMDKERKMDDIRSKFSQGARDYDAKIRSIIPRYDEMLDILISCSTANDDKKLKVIDIGCGTGALSEKLLNARPDAQLTCLDMTEAMLDLAKERMKGCSNARYVLSDLYDFQFDGPFDLVISSLALHHIVSDEDKRSLYRRLYNALGPGGSFYNADLVLGSDDGLQILYMERWAEFLSRNLTQDEVENAVLLRYRQEDSPARLVDHLRWLNEAGFIGVDVVWKYYNFAVYGGKRD